MAQKTPHERGGGVQESKMAQKTPLTGKDWVQDSIMIQKPFAKKWSN